MQTPPSCSATRTCGWCSSPSNRAIPLIVLVASASNCAAGALRSTSKNLRASQRLKRRALIGQFSEQEAVFHTPRAIQCYSGTAPVTIQSGKKKIVVFRRSCNKFLRFTFQYIAFCSLKQVKWARESYDRQKSKGKSHSLALRNLANQWAEIIFAIWQKREKYDEQVYLSHRQSGIKKTA